MKWKFQNDTETEIRHHLTQLKSSSYGTFSALLQTNLLVQLVVQLVSILERSQTILVLKSKYCLVKSDDFNVSIKISFSEVRRFE